LSKQIISNDVEVNGRTPVRQMAAPVHGKSRVHYFHYKYRVNLNNQTGTRGAICRVAEPNYLRIFVVNSRIDVDIAVSQNGTTLFHKNQ
jgi:hypothetical protein